VTHLATIEPPKERGRRDGADQGDERDDDRDLEERDASPHDTFLEVAGYLTAIARRGVIGSFPRMTIVLQ
jgi:hypothetical protein